MLLVVVLLPVAALTLFTPFYQTNDDVAMRLLAEGNFVPGAEPLPYLLFINVIVGQLLTLAYELRATVPWYDLVLGGSMIVASAALLHLWIGVGRDLEIVWTLLFATYFLLPMFVSVQFSLAGLTCAAAGIGLIARAGLTDLEPRSRQLHLQLGTTLFVWGSLIRLEGAVLIALEAAAVAFPFVMTGWRGADRWRGVRGMAQAACVAILLAGVGFGVNQLTYRQAKGWNDFYEYNFLRARLWEYMTPARMASEAEAMLAKDVGWSPNDLVVFRNWFFTDPELFSLATVRRAERLFYGESDQPEADSPTARLQQGLELGKDFFRQTRWAFLLMGAFVLAHGFRPRLTIYFAGIALTLLSLAIAIGLVLKAPPQRIFHPMLIMAATMLSIAGQRWGRPTHWLPSLAATVTAVCVIAVTLPPLKRESEERRIAAAGLQSEVNNLRRTDSTLFVLHGDSFPYENYWTPLHTERAPFDFVGLGASQRTPPVQNFLAATGRSDLPWSLCIDPAMVLVADPRVPPWLTTFIKEHHGVSVQFDSVFQGEFIHAWKCHRR